MKKYNLFQNPNMLEGYLVIGEWGIGVGVGCMAGI